MTKRIKGDEMSHGRQRLSMNFQMIKLKRGLASDLAEWRKLS
jgi:hypothetical protein